VGTAQADIHHRNNPMREPRAVTPDLQRRRFQKHPLER
jgi:hypothetical protein